MSSDLQKVKQNESLWSYVDRFNIEPIQVDNLNIETIREVIKKECRNSKFIESFIKNSTRDYFQLMEKIRKYIMLDDERQSLKI